MKKILKRTVSAGLAVSMALMPCFPVFADTANPVVTGADEEGKCSIAVEGAVEGHKYKVYQIFTGSAGADGTTLGNVKYGAVYGEEAGKSVPASVLEGIKDAKEFAKSIKDKLTGTPAAILTKENASAGTEPGYYVIVDTVDGEMAAGDAVSDFIVATAGTVTFKPKATTVPTLDKKIDTSTEDSVIVAPAEEITNWEYTVNEEAGTVTLNRYTGTGTDVTVYPVYVIEGKEYKTVIASNTEDSEDYMFAGSSVGTVVFENGIDMSGTSDISGMFKGCDNLTSADFGDMDTSHVTDMGSLFEGCTSLPAADLSGFDTGNVTNMDNIFTGCGNLTSVSVTEGKWDTSHVENPGDILEGTGASFDVKENGGVHTVHIYEKSVSKDATCTETGEVKYSCTVCGSEYTSVIPAGEHKYTNGICDFCGKEKENYISPSSNEILSWEYTIDENNKTVTLHKNNCNQSDVIVYANYIINGKTYKTQIADASSHNMLDYMFSNGKIENEVKHITFSDDLDISNLNSIAGMFTECTQLQTIHFGEAFKHNNITDMSELFSVCDALNSVDFENLDTSNVTNMSSMFHYSSFANLDLSCFDTKNVTDMSSMFSGSTLLENINLGGFDTRNVISMSMMFYSCSNLKKLNLTSFDTSNVTNTIQMFNNNTNLEVVNVSSKWNTSKANTSNMFTGCKISSVTVITPDTKSQKNLAKLQNAGILPQAMAETDSIAVSGSETSVKYGKGDAVPFSLTATMPESISAYDTYKLVFNDKLSKGFDYDETSFSVYVDGKKVDASACSIKFSEDKKSFSLSIDDAKAEPFNAVAGTEIVVKYKAVLNEDAGRGNTNDASLEYSNDPNGEGTGTTEPGKEDIVTVFTFSVAFDKVDGDGNALSGAGFTLYKKGEDGSYNEFTEEIKDTTSFNFNGLATGDYKLVESATPDGYNTMEDLLFSIVAESDKAADGTSKITSLKIVDAEGNALDRWAADADALSFTSDIANYTGATLPSTGGTGTAVFYITGGILVLAAGVVAVSKKKAKEGQE